MKTNTMGSWAYVRVVFLKRLFCPKTELAPTKRTKKVFSKWLHSTWWRRWSPRMKRVLAKYTGLFVRPSGISDPCGTVAEMVTPKGSMSTEGETLQVSVLPYRCSICAPLLTSEGSWQTFLAHARQSRPMAPAGLFVSQRTGSHSARISCTTHELFCP